MVAFATTAPDLSETRPWSEAVMVWAKAAGHNNKAKISLKTRDFMGQLLSPRAKNIPRKSGLGNADFGLEEGRCVVGPVGFEPTTNRLPPKMQIPNESVTFPSFDWQK